MLSTLEDITRRLVERYQPDRIILFGSRAKGAEGPSRDVDLLIVKQTDRRAVERRREVEALLSDRALPLDVVVYTPDEMRYLYFIGSPFVEEVVETGRVLYMRAVTSAWVRDANDELASAHVLLERGLFRTACYHSQQAVEKGLKALLLEKGDRPHRVHDIVDLHNRVAALGWSVPLSMDDSIFLNAIYKGRYPTDEGLLPHGEPSRDEASRAVEAARRLVAGVTALLPSS